MKFLFKCAVCNQVMTVEGALGQSPVPPEACSCGGELRRFYTPLGVVYRGSGYYTTDKALYEPPPDDPVE